MWYLRGGGGEKRIKRRDKRGNGASSESSLHTSEGSWREEVIQGF
jgi:hypothetical protein